MARAKYIILFFLFFAVLLFTGESYTYFLENFQDSYTQVGYFLSAGESEEARLFVTLYQVASATTSPSYNVFTTFLK